MKVWTPIFNFIAIFLLIIMLPSYYIICKNLDKEFDQQRLDKAVDYATKAMMLAATDVDNIELDYINPDSIVLTPGEALNIFDIVMCFNYEMETTHYNMNAIENSVCALVLSDEYGYYIAEEVEDDLTPDDDIVGDNYAIRWSMRIPYTETLANGGKRTYSYNYYPILEWADNKRDTNPTLAKTPIDENDNTLKEKIKTQINEQISSAINAEINRKKYLLGISANGEEFHLPSQVTKLGVNPIEGPSAMVILNNATFASNYKIDAVNVGGYMARSKEFIVCFEMANGEGGKTKYYCYSKQLPAKDQGSVVTYVENMRDACKQGYSPYWPYLMTNKYLENQ